MKKYLAVLGRQPLISLAELESLFANVQRIAPSLAEFTLSTGTAGTESGAPSTPPSVAPVASTALSASTAGSMPGAPNIHRLGGILKIAEPITVPLPKFLASLPSDGKITLGVSDYSRGASARTASKVAFNCKKILAKAGRSVRTVPNQGAVLSNATSLHNHLFGERKIELIKLEQKYYRVTQLSNIESYARRDQARPARDARVGMLPPKLAQILLNLAGNLPAGARVLDPFCGTGVVLQEAALDGYVPYGTDQSQRMIDYTLKNLEWLAKHQARKVAQPAWLQKTILEVGDATTHQWQPPISAVVAETYLGPPMSAPPAEIKLRSVKTECQALILAFLKNLAPQLESGTPVVIAVPAWLRPDGHYARLSLDEIPKLRYNVCSFNNLEPDDLLYFREGQVVARDIIVLRKK